MSKSNAVYATAFVAEFERRKRAGITENFQIGYPYRGIQGSDAWEEWCADLAHEYAEEMARQSERASNRRASRRHR